jgi:hypothetical protein
MGKESSQAAQIIIGHEFFLCRVFTRKWEETERKCVQNHGSVHLPYALEVGESWQRNPPPGHGWPLCHLPRMPHLRHTTFHPPHHALLLFLVPSAPPLWFYTPATCGWGGPPLTPPPVIKSFLFNGFSQCHQLDWACIIKGRAGSSPVSSSTACEWIVAR